MTFVNLPAGTFSDAPGTDQARIKSVVRVDSRTGHLVRTIEIPRSRRAAIQAQSETAETSTAGVRSIVEETARNYDVDPLLVNSVIQTESAFQPTAISAKGAQGLMQLMPATARRFGVSDTFDPKENIEGGVKYLKYLQGMFQDDRLAIAAYNAGEGAVAKYNGVPPYKETVEYVEKVAKKYDRARQTAASRKPPARSAPPKPEEEPHPAIAQYVDAQGRLHILTR